MNHHMGVRAVLENLENRVLFAQTSVTDFGAVPGDGRDDRAAIQNAINSAAAGDTITFDAGEYDVGGTLLVKSGRTLRGADNLGTLLRFQLDFDQWGMDLESSAHDVTIDGFRFDGGGITLNHGRYRNITIKNNDITRPAPGTYSGNGPAIFQGGYSDGLRIENNTIHDFEKYGVVLFNMDRLRFVGNTISNVMQGGHFLNVGEDSVISNNKLSGMVRMGFEIQRLGDNYARNLTVEGNIIIDWRKAFPDSFALSVVPDGSTNVRVINNYIRLGSPEWLGGREARAGYGIEYGAQTGEISGNVIGGDRFANHIIVSGAGGMHNNVIPVRNNKLYASPMWVAWITTQAGGGPGFGFRDEGNVTDRNLGNMAGPPERPTPTPTPTPKPKPTPTPRPVPTPKPPLQRTTPPPVPVGPMPSPSQGDFDWLTDLSWSHASNAWGPVEIDRANGERAANDGGALRIDGRQFDRGLGVAMNSEIIYQLDGEYEKFSAHIGVDDYAGRRGSVTFEVWADGQKIYDSGVMTGRMAGRDVAVNVRNVQELRLVTTDGGDGGRADHADWADAKLVRPA